MELPEDMVPQAGYDLSSKESYLMTLDELRSALADGLFKLDCAVTWLSYLVQHGHLTAENEPDLVEICARLHRNLDFFVI